MPRIKLGLIKPFNIFLFLEEVSFLIEECKNKNNGKVRHVAEEPRFESNVLKCCEFDLSKWDGHSK